MRKWVGSILMVAVIAMAGISFTTDKAWAHYYEVEVQRGIALLDKHGPANWREKIDLERLMMDDEKNGILGQLYGKYSKGVKALPLNSKRQTELYGFDIDRSKRTTRTVNGRILYSYKAAYLKLTAGWIEALSDSN